MIAFDPVVLVFSADVSDSICLRLVLIDLIKYLAIGVGFISPDGHGLVQPYSLSLLLQKSSGGIGVTPCRQAKTDQLTSLIDSPPEIIPTTFMRIYVSSTCQLRPQDLAIAVETPPQCSTQAFAFFGFFSASCGWLMTSVTIKYLDQGNFAAT
ncbi:MAG: hypothetical protein ACRBM6_17590 [Geminicoccales bacterium]